MINFILLRGVLWRHCINTFVTLLCHFFTVGEHIPGAEFTKFKKNIYIIMKLYMYLLYQYLSNIVLKGL